MLMIVLRKMFRNKWLVLCLLIGCILSIAMVGSVPAYTDAVFQRMLTKTLEEYQEETGKYPGQYYVKAAISSGFKEADRVTAFLMFDREIDKRVKEIGVPYTAKNMKITLYNMNITPEIPRDIREKSRSLKLEALNDMENHIEILFGKMYTDEPKDGIYEVIVTEAAMKRHDLLLNEVYVLKDTRVEPQIRATGKQVPKIKVVGVFTMKDEKDPYWHQGIKNFESVLVMDIGQLRKDFIDTKSTLLTSAEWYYALDYHKILLGDIAGIQSAYDSNVAWYGNYKMSITFTMPIVVDVLGEYKTNEATLRTTLLILQVPILLMLAFYIFMVSQLIIEHEKNEIAVMKSRGASKSQIFLSYLMQSLILSGIALIIGPPLGIFLCSVIGSSNGFMEFVQRTALPVQLNLKNYIYSFSSAILFIITMLIPAFLSSRTNIVQYKQKRARLKKTAVWKKYFFDILLLAISGYGWYMFKTQQQVVGALGVKGTELGMNPVLFIVCTLFIIGVGLFFLRIYPLLIQFIFWVGKRIWSPVLFASFVQVGRSGGQEQFLMLFIILTLSIGIFSANTARTINSNMEDRIKYTQGADIVLKARWKSIGNASLNDPMSVYASMFGDEFGEEVTVDSSPLQFQEPPYVPYTKIEGIEQATRVFSQAGVEARVGNTPWIKNINIMGIVPDEFGKTAYFRNDLAPEHWYNYLNLLAENPKAMLVSNSFKDKYDVKIGSLIYMQAGAQKGVLEGIVYGFIDYWPGFNPSSTLDVPAYVDGKQVIQKERPTLIVFNLNYMQDILMIEPYQVWLKREPQAETADIYADMEAMGLDIEAITVTAPIITENKNDPALMGTNGSLTLGFLVTMIISTIGFIIYWVLSIRSRILQFGILRAMGLSLMKVLGMLFCEQLMISGVAILMGIIVGGYSSNLFVPLLQIIYSTEQQVLPFIIIASPEDYIRVYSFAGGMLLVGLVALGGLVARININQAIKLGED